MAVAILGADLMTRLYGLVLPCGQCPFCQSIVLDEEGEMKIACWACGEKSLPKEHNLSAALMGCCKHDKLKKFCQSLLMLDESPQ